MRARPLIPALAFATALSVVAWLVASGDDRHGAEPQSAADPSTAASAQNRSTLTAAPGRANVARPAPTQIHAGRPRVLSLPSGATMSIDASATGADGALQIPADVKRAGWWDGSSRLGDPFGSIVVAAHVDSFSQGLGRFVELLSMHRGDVVMMRSHHLEQRFVVTSAHLVPKSEVSASSSLYWATGHARLVLITCGGDYTPDTGYADNMVVVARPASPPMLR